MSIIQETLAAAADQAAANGVDPNSKTFAHNVSAVTADPSEVAVVTVSSPKPERTGGFVPSIT